MPIEFRCQQCDRLLRTGDDTVGRQAQCPECGAITNVPGPQVGPERSAEQPGTPDPWPDGPSATGDLPSAEPGDPENPYRSPGEYAGGLYAAAPLLEHGQRPGTDMKALASVVLGLSAVVFCCIPIFGLPLGITGIVLGAGALQSRSQGAAIAGIILCSIGSLLGLLMAALWLFAFLGPVPLFP